MIKLWTLDFVSHHTTPSCPLSTLIVFHDSNTVVFVRLINHCYWWEWEWVLVRPHPVSCLHTAMVAMATMATKDINPQPISHHQYQYQALDFRFCISIHTTPSCPLSTLIVTHYSTVVHSCGDWGLINHCYWWEWEWVLVSEEAPLPPRRMHTEHSFPLLELQLSWLQPPAT